MIVIREDLRSQNFEIELLGRREMIQMQIKLKIK